MRLLFARAQKANVIHRIDKKLKTAYRFVLNAYLGPMVLTFFIVMFILLMQFMWMNIDMLVGKGLSMGVIVELLMYASATLIPMGLPLATLLASIMTMGNLGENNELLALKAAGISLPRIMKPLIVLMFFVSIGSFFVINNLAPYSTRKMISLISDISKQNQELKFQDGIFFNGLPDRSIRVARQDPKTNLLTDVLIYDNSSYDKMRTTVADSGYIRISEDKLYLEITLFNGQFYEENRNYEWYTKNVLSHQMFARQDMIVPISGFALERSDIEAASNLSETKNINELLLVIDSLSYSRDSISTRFTNQLVKNYTFKRYTSVADLDSLPKYKESQFILGRIDTMNVIERKKVFTQAKQAAVDAQNYVNYEVEFVRYPSTNLYRSQADFQRKLSLPFSVMIFFLIGAAFGAIIRKGGLGMPIVVSVAFFVVYYVISMIGKKFLEDGVMSPFVGVWLPSFVLFPMAIFLTYKSTNDSALFNSDAYINVYKKVTRFTTTLYKRNYEKNS